MSYFLTFYIIYFIYDILCITLRFTLYIDVYKFTVYWCDFSNLFNAANVF